MLLNKLVAKVKGDTPTDVALPPDNFIKDMVDSADREPIQNRAGTFTGNVHVSSLSKGFCARKYAIAIREQLPLYETVTGGHRVVWAQGRASEEYLRQTFIDKYGKRNIYANWGCERQIDDDPEGMHTFEQRFWKPAKCKCGGNLNKLHEPMLYNKDAGVVGRPDLVFRYQNWAHIVEIKSIKSEIDSPNKNQHSTFEDLEKPIDDHIRQASFYPDLLKRREPTLQVSPYVRYVYIAKNFKFGSPYKEFVVNHDNPTDQRELTERYEDARLIKDFMATGKLPPRVCPVFGAPMSKKCAVNSRCFYTYDDPE